MKRGVKKTKAGFSIDIELLEEFEIYCDDNFINRSKLVNKLINDFLKKIKVEDVKVGKR
jgi:metal-responsive CopG/Arc/MetJ family transcriptional regulator